MSQRSWSVGAGLGWVVVGGGNKLGKEKMDEKKKSSSCLVSLFIY